MVKESGSSLGLIYFLGGIARRDGGSQKVKVKESAGILGSLGDSVWRLGESSGVGPGREWESSESQ